VATDVSTFFGDADLSYATTTVDALTSGIDYRLKSGVLVRNRTRFTAYDKFYQNVYPSTAVSADGTSVTIGAYNHWTPRRNLFSQTDVNLVAATGRIRHTLLAGVEVGRQASDNLRKTGYFGGSATTAIVRVADPSIAVPIAFRPSATDADNGSLGTVASAYVQDQAELSRFFQTIAGLRYDRFNVDVHNNRTAADLSSRDNLVSPRLGLVYKPAPAISVYSSYSLTYLPRAGEQLSSLSITNQALEPERFTNYEVGAKWDFRPDFGVTAALYRLDRTNVAVPDPADPPRSMLIAGQRAKGLELSAAGNVTTSWSLIGAYAFQNGVITRTLSSTAQEGARLGQMPAYTFSLWNKYRVSARWAAGAGVVRNASMFTSTDNTVVLPAFTRLDAALFVTVTRQLRAQINVENLFDEHYFSSANGNNNIAPGAPRALRFSLTTRF
jgi:catecholate siderophore receptor